MNTEQQREPIDRKFAFCATSCEHGREHSHMDAMVFLAKDKNLPDALLYYQNRCQESGASAEQLQGITLLIERVKRYQAEHPDQVKIADVDIPDNAGILDENEK